MIHAKDDEYLYSKDEYVEEEQDQQVAATTEEQDDQEEFDLPDISDEEIPDFLVGEDVDKI